MLRRSPHIVLTGVTIMLQVALCLVTEMSPQVAFWPAIGIALAVTLAMYDP